MPAHHQMVPMHHLGAAFEAQDQENIGRRAAFDLLGIVGVIGHQAAADLVAVGAADEAAAALAFDSAARFCRMALELEPTEEDDVLSLQRKLGDALGNAGRGAEAVIVIVRQLDRIEVWRRTRAASQ